MRSIWYDSPTRLKPLRWSFATDIAEVSPEFCWDAPNPAILYPNVKSSSVLRCLQHDQFKQFGERYDWNRCTSLKQLAAKSSFFDTSVFTVYLVHPNEGFVMRERMRAHRTEKARHNAYFEDIFSNNSILSSRSRGGIVHRSLSVRSTSNLNLNWLVNDRSHNLYISPLTSHLSASILFLLLHL